MNTQYELTQKIIAATSRKSASKSVLHQKIMKILAEYHVEQKTNKSIIDLQTHINHFIAAKHIDGLSSKTLSNYRLYLSLFAKFINKNADDITTNDIRNYMGSQKVCDNSLHTILNTLRSFFSWLTTEEIILKNPTLKIKMKSSHNKNVRKSLSLEELERLRNACVTIKEKTLVEFFYSTGCRVSEVVGIQLSDIDFVQRSIRVKGKGKKERIVYFSVKTKLLLEKYLEQCNSSNMLFTNNRAPYTALHTRSVQKIIKQLGERAKLPEKVHPHLLRHTFATLSLNGGMDITIIQKLLGHSHLSTTEIYAQISQANIRQAYDRIVA